MYAQFDNSLLTGNKVIDEQHKEWIGKINELLSSCECGDCKVKAIKTLEYMADYSEFHFREEEKLQEEAGYPGLEAHKRKHDEFRKVVDELHEMLREEEGPSEAFVEAVKKNVVDWLYNHIKAFDCSVAAYINMKDHPERIQNFKIEQMMSKKVAVTQSFF